MVTEGIILGHKIFEKRLEVDIAKILVIEYQPPNFVKSIRSFLRHVELYKRFIKDFSKISKQLCQLLVKVFLLYLILHILKPLIL